MRDTAKIPVRYQKLIFDEAHPPNCFEGIIFWGRYAKNRHLAYEKKIVLVGWEERNFAHDFFLVRKVRDGTSHHEERTGYVFNKKRITTELIELYLFVA